MDGVYCPIDVKQMTASTLPQDSEHLVFHRHNNINCEFKIIDSVSKLADRPENWDRVVAVFATGQPWQFKNWKWSEPVDLFQNVLGVHLMYADSETNPTVQSWNCKIIKVSV
jgi:RNA pol II accessory factor, Cdc73 family, C-terminal